MSFNSTVIKQTFDNIRPVSDATVTHLFETLWNDYPETKAYFANANMAQTRESFFKAWTYIIDHLDDTERLTVFLKAMGGRHVNYGIESAKVFEWMGTSLMAALGKSLGTAWTPEVQIEWTKAYTSFANSMIEGMHTVQSLRSESGVTVKGHLQTAPAPAPVVVTPTVPRFPSEEESTTPMYKSNNSNGGFNNNLSDTDFELPQNLKEQIGKAASDLIAKKIQDEYNKALKAELEKVSTDDLVNLIKKVA